MVLVKESSHVRTITLNRPMQLNALSFEMISRLLELFHAYEENPDVKLQSTGGLDDYLAHLTRESPLQSTEYNLISIRRNIEGTMSEAAIPLVTSALQETEGSVVGPGPGMEFSMAKDLLLGLVWSSPWLSWFIVCFALLPVLGGTWGVLQGVISMTKSMVAFLAVLSVLSRSCLPWFLKLMISLSSQIEKNKLTVALVVANKSASLNSNGVHEVLVKESSDVRTITLNKMLFHLKW
ncbi:hypothetical protein L2E82_01288 [Cichorium intybus]|uniref:Uncharacterized protein n=1 Tax=Cichorium intybus TaxID=13427 RepID=A0ACB9GYG1_CICIN|nr:hypothetical protein L2E82_01288 [Cichorium intybus]